MIVIDASVAIELAAQTPHAQAIGARMGQAESDLICAPDLIDLEVAQGLRRWVLLKNISEGRAGQAMRDWVQLSVMRHPHEHLLGRIWEMRHNLSAYDAAYVALAEFLSAPLLTRDGKLAKAPGHQAVIELV